MSDVFSIPNPNFFVFVVLRTAHSWRMSDAEQTEVKTKLLADEHVLDVEHVTNQAVYFRLKLGFDVTLGGEIRRLKRLVGGRWVKDAYISKNPLTVSMLRRVEEANERPKEAAKAEIPFRTYRC